MELHLRSATISKPVERRINTIITCPYLGNILGDEISISDAENNFLKIYEVDIIGIVFASFIQLS